MVYGRRHTRDRKHLPSPHANKTIAGRVGPHEGQFPCPAGATQSNQWRIEKLGSRTFQNISSEGTRRTQTTPAGEEGNALQLEVINEIWFSRELGVTMMSIQRRSQTRTNDCRSGRASSRRTRSGNVCSAKRLPGQRSESGRCSRRRHSIMLGGPLRFFNQSLRSGALSSPQSHRG